MSRCKLLRFTSLLGLIAASAAPSWAAATTADDVPLCTLPVRERAIDPDVTSGLLGRSFAPTLHGGPSPHEVEPNDTAAEANPLDFGTGPSVSDDLDVSGTLVDGTPESITVLEDDGAIPLANPTGLGSNDIGAASGTVGDGPHAANAGDYDFYRVSALAGERISVDVDAQSIGSGLDSYVGIYDGSGTLLASNDDAGGSSDSFLTWIAPNDDDYFVVVRGFGAGFQNDPFDSGSGAGIGSTGFYGVDIEVGDSATDVFRFELEAGDVVGVNAVGGGHLVVHGPDTGEVVGSSQDVTAIYPSSSPLPGGGDVALSWVAALSGTYAIAISGGSGVYGLQLRAFRPVIEQQPVGSRQVLFLDFDGAVMDASRFGGSGVRTLSPLASFLDRWGLSGSDEDAVIDAVVARVRQDFAVVGASGANGDFVSSGIDGQFALEVRNSRDDGALWGQPHLTRVVIGGTVSELGINTIGISEAIDVGNFATEETAVVLLDNLSDPNGANPRSLNRFEIDAPLTIVDLIGAAVGHAVSHEAGHLFGSFHTDRFNHEPCLMDVGGDIGHLIGVGEDEIFGSADDVDVRFLSDIYYPSEGFTGTQDTLNVNAFGLSTGTGPIVDTPTASATATATETQPEGVTATATQPPTSTPTRTPTAPTATPTRTISPTPPQPGTCASAPRADCRSPRKSAFSLRTMAGNPDRSRFKWKWLQGKGEREDWGAPDITTSYDVCLYDAGGLRMALTVDAGGTCAAGIACWQSNRRGFKFKDRSGTQDGLQQIHLLASNGRVSAKLTGGGAALPAPTLPLYVPVTLQLVSSQGRCWTANYPKLEGNNLDRILAR